MKKKILYILLGIVVILLIALTGFLLSGNRTSPTAELTQDRIERLQCYPYYGGEPKLGFDRIIKERSYLSKHILGIFFGEIVNFKDNEDFYTNERLTYYTNEYNYAVRGILQTNEDDGTITEQDVEYIFKLKSYGTDDEFTTYMLDKFIQLGDKVIINE